MHALGEHVDLEFPADQAAQRCCQPELLVIAASRVQRDAQARLPDAGRQMLDVVREIEAAAFFASLDDHHASRVSNRVRLQRADRAQTREHRVPVVSAAAAIQTLAVEHRLPRTQPFAPSRHLGLLVHVPIEQHAILGVAGDFDEQQRGPAFEAHDFQLHAADRLAARPILEARDDAVHVTVRFPVAIERDRLVGDTNVLDQFGDYGFIPKPLDVSSDR